MPKLKNKKSLRLHRPPYPAGIELQYLAALLKILKNTRRLFDSLVMPHVRSGLEEMKRIRRFDDREFSFADLYLIEEGAKQAAADDAKVEE